MCTYNLLCCVCTIYCVVCVCVLASGGAKNNITWYVFWSGCSVINNNTLAFVMAHSTIKVVGCETKQEPSQLQQPNR